MYTSLKIKKQTGTYSDSIEAFGVANLVNEIFSRNDIGRNKIDIEDKGLYYEIIPRPEISEDMVNSLNYFPVFKWVTRSETETFDEDYFNYEKENKLKKERQELLKVAREEFVGKNKKKQLDIRIAEINRIFKEEKQIKPEVDVYAQISDKDNIISFRKLYNNFNQNKDKFSKLIYYILDYYQNKDIKIDKKEFKNFEENPSALQLYNPTMGKGVNRTKPTGAGTAGVNSNWISETMKISGTITNMLCQLVMVGGKFDMKIVVPDFKKIQFGKQRNIVFGFKKNIKGNTPLKIDILNLLILVKKLIENTEEFNGIKARNIISGVHSTYQKSLGHKRAVINIAKLQTPDFIAFDSKDEAKDWIEILDEQIRIIFDIDEKIDAYSGAIQALLNYRTFITSSHFNSWVQFVHWYSGHILSNLSKNKFTLQFNTNTLNKFFKNMSMKNFKISEIISNEGFQKVADAIRNSTVILQGAKSRGQKIFFEVRYGMAQELKNKSKTSADLAAFIGDFIGTYNAETARKSELNKAYRKPVRDNELNEFYTLLDNYPSKVVGALLSSYGFALTEKDTDKEEAKKENEQVETN